MVKLFNDKIYQYRSVLIIFLIQIFQFLLIVDSAYDSLIVYGKLEVDECVMNQFSNITTLTLINTVVDCGKECVINQKCAMFQYDSWECRLFEIKVMESENVCFLKSNSNKRIYIPNSVPSYFTKDCKQLKKYSPSLKSGVYLIQSPQTKEHLPIPLYCDMTTTGWILLQRRQSGSLDFNKLWQDFKIGFGDVHDNFWLGNDRLHQFASSGSIKLRIDLWDKDDVHRYAEYENFSVGSEAENYQLMVSGYSGTAGDTLKLHNGLGFSTIDRDNDNWSEGSCSQSYKSAWWFDGTKGCLKSNLNGLYGIPGTAGWDGIIWNDFRSREYLKKSEMKLAFN